MQEQIKLVELLGGNQCLGSLSGRVLFKKLKDTIEGLIVDQAATCHVIEIQLAGIERLDLTFVRESIAAITKSMLGECYLVVTEAENQDVFDNLNHGYIAKNTYGYYLEPEQFKILGPTLSPAATQLIKAIAEIKEDEVTSSMISAAMNISVQSISGRLKRLSEIGLLAVRKGSAKTGGPELYYRLVIKK